MPGEDRDTETPKTELVRPQDWVVQTVVVVQAQSTTSTCSALLYTINPYLVLFTGGKLRATAVE